MVVVKTSDNSSNNNAGGVGACGGPEKCFNFVVCTYASTSTMVCASSERREASKAGGKNSQPLPNFPAESGLHRGSQSSTGPARVVGDHSWSTE